MTSGQRKAHLTFWLIIVIVVPLLVFFSIRDLDLTNSKPDSFPIMESARQSIASAENELVKASIFEIDSVRSIEIILKSPLKNPSSIVYAMQSGQATGPVIGQITVVGIYNFSISELPEGLLIYDELKKVEITKLKF